MHADELVPVEDMRRLFRDVGPHCTLAVIVAHGLPHGRLFSAAMWPQVSLNGSDFVSKRPVFHVYLRT